MRFEKVDINAIIPTRATALSAGYDLCALEDAYIRAGQAEIIRTGIRIVDMPPGYQAEVRSRSGMALKTRVVVLNSPGTIDADYNDEIKVILINHSQALYTVQAGTRIAQLVFTRYFTVEGDTASGVRTGGFGSTNGF